MLYYGFRLHNSFMAQLYHTFFPYDMFRPDGAIFGYVGVYTITFMLFATLPTLASFYTLGVRRMHVLCLPFFFLKFIVYWDV
jgi:hypothetical protein